MTARQPGWIEQWNISWEPLPPGRHGEVPNAKVSPTERTIVFDLSVPDPIPDRLMSEIEAKLAGRDDDAPHCRNRARLVVLEGGRDSGALPGVG